MRIVIVVPSLGVGGCERYVATIADSLGQAAEVVVIYQSTIGEAMDSLLVNVRHRPMNVVAGTADPLRRFWDVLAPLRADHIVAVLPLPTTEPGGPDPLHLLEAAAGLAPTTVVFQLAHQPESVSRVDRERARRLVDAANQRWIAVSAQNQKSLASSFDIPIDSISVVPNGTTSTRFAPLDRPRPSPLAPAVLLQVGRLVRWKAQEDSIKALQLMAHPAVLWLVGEGYDRERLSVLARERNVAERVRFLGKRDDVSELMACADVVLHPTLAEGASFALLEAMAAARPIVASNAASNPELLRHGSDGWIHPTKRPDIQAAQIDDALARPNEARRRARLAHARVSSLYSVQGMVDGLRAVIERRS